MNNNIIIKIVYEGYTFTAQLMHKIDCTYKRIDPTTFGIVNARIK